MKGNKLAGLLLIVFGSFYLVLQVLGQMGIVLFRIWDFWPLIIVGLGVMFEAFYFSHRRGFGFLIPGGILTTIGLLHLFETLTNWYFAAYTWPIYTFAVFIGFIQVYLVTKQQWAYIVSFIIFCAAAFQGMISLSLLIGKVVSTDLAFSSLVIIIGLLLLFGSKKKKDTI